ncbi:MAG: hypothetical protein ACUVX8_16865, partial [Candidatus Zipacnadales bacterium]
MYIPRVGKMIWVILLIAVPAAAQVSENLLANHSFEDAVDVNNVPVGWQLYAGVDERRHFEIVRPGNEGERALLLDDEDPQAEIGLNQTVSAEPLVVYEASVMVKGVVGRPSAGAYLQLRFLPSNKYVQVSLAAPSTDSFTRVAVKGIAPEDTEKAVLYLYSHREPRPAVILDSVALVSGAEPPPPPPPEPIPPVYTKLKELYLETTLVRNGKAEVTIVAPASGRYNKQAQAIQEAIQDLTGVEPPIVSDTSPEAAVPIVRNLIVLGNRSTNRTISQLYDLYYTLLDLRYPGPHGYEVRTLHNPFGDGRNVIFVGGSDDTGVARGAEVLIQKLKTADGNKGALTIGRLMEIRLGDGIRVPTDLREFETWEASRGYGSTGYFGWNSLSKRMAMYYMTGDEFHAREFIRLAFPDEQAKAEIAAIDEERIEDKDDPLKGPYHYNAHMMILFWDLIEESPVFSDEERLAVTNAFSRQLNHRKGEGIYGRMEPPAHVGTRHGQWSAISLYCLGRYFQKDYPNPIWAHCIEAAKLHFKPLHEHAWVSGENDNLFWYNTAIAPILTYLVLTGDRVPVENGVLAQLLRGQEILATGGPNHWDLNSAAISFLHQAAYLTGDGRWLTYRDRTGVDLSVFRLGQSFWPDETLQPQQPTDLVGRWSIQPMPFPMWQWRENGFPIEQSFLFGSYRSTTDMSGDYLLIDGFNGESRNPYHTFAILNLRLNSHPLLAGYRNQVLTRADGLVEPDIAKDAALRAHDVLGNTVYAVGEVPDAAYCNWRRTLLQRTGRYAVIVDDLAFRTDAANMAVQTLWEPSSASSWDPNDNVLRIQTRGTGSLPPGWRHYRALDSECSGQPSGEEAIRQLNELGIVLLRATEPGNWLQMRFALPHPHRGEVFAELLNYTDRGVIAIDLDGVRVVPEYDHQASTATTARVSLGQHNLSAGEHVLRLTALRRHEGNDRCYIGLAGVVTREEGAAASKQVSAYHIAPCDLMDTAVRSGVYTMEWCGPVKRGTQRIQFSAIAPCIEEERAPVCLRLADNVAAMALPEAAVAIAGKFENIEAETAIVSESHLFGRSLTSVAPNAPLLRADKPIDIDWEFSTGVVTVNVPDDTRVSLSFDPQRGTPKLDDGPDLRWSNTGMEATTTLPHGRHVLTGVWIPDELREKLVSWLRHQLTTGQHRRTQLLAARQTQPPVMLPDLPQAMATQVASEVVDLVAIPQGADTLLAVAEGQTVHLLSMEGVEVGTLQADGPIRMLRWWAEYGLLLVGCADEQVIAFALNGERKWVFTSEMHPDVFRAAKTYWFKSAPGHEGIHGLYTGVFLEGKSQAFVGSACTLEILNEYGKLIKRLPVFWGQGYVMNVVD